jgi:hypothetical protein
MFDDYTIEWLSKRGYLSWHLRGQGEAIIAAVRIRPRAIAPTAPIITASINPLHNAPPFSNTLLGTAKVIVIVVGHDTEEKPKKVSSGSSTSFNG